MKSHNPDSMLCTIAGSIAAVHWLPINYPLGAKLNDALCFAWGLPDTGFSFQARSREDRTALDDLRRRGLVDVHGQTSGIRVSLTLAGAACFWDLDHSVGNLRELADMPHVNKTPWGQSIILGHELCPTAGDWFKGARSTDAAWNAYRDELQNAMSTLKPQFVLGWVKQFVSSDQQLWAVQLSDAGHKALDTTMPGETPGFQWDEAAYTHGWNEAVKRYSTNPPDSENTVARMLPCAKWF